MKAKLLPAAPQALDHIQLEILRQPHVRQVEDRALPAWQVLRQQEQARDPEDQSPVFVP
jgi:hypothetical protein